MEKIRLSFLVNLLKRSLIDKENLSEHMMEFEDIVGENEIVETSKQHKFQMEELASFIPYFSPTSVNSVDDAVLIDENKMLEMIEDTLNKVKKVQ